MLLNAGVDLCVCGCATWEREGGSEGEGGREEGGKRRGTQFEQYLHTTVTPAHRC
jgi:hypothetical protein